MKDGEVIAQIETDKVTIDVKYTSAKPGKVTEVVVSEGDTVSVGHPVVKVEEIEGEMPAEGGAPPAAEKSEAPSPPKPAEQQVAKPAPAAAPKPPPTPPPTPPPKVGRRLIHLLLQLKSNMCVGNCETHLYAACFEVAAL